MKLRTKLIITFLTLILVPIIFTGAAFFGFGRYQINSIKEMYGVEVEALFLDMTLTIVLLLIFTSLLLTAWIYKSMVTPIHHLQNKELISNISHDLKTPIAAVKGYVEGLMDGVADTPEKQEKYIRTIYNKANDMDRLINELSFYSKIDTNRIPYTFEKINVNAYFADCIEELSIELEEQNIELSYSNYVDENVLVIADAEQIKRVINNIVGNSVKYIDKSKGRVNIRVKDVGDFIQVEIEDNGKGIAAKDLPQIFDRFYRADVSRNSSKGGSGIGLSIVKKIIEDHGGQVWATSKEQTGTVMYFVLRKYQEVPVT